MGTTLFAIEKPVYMLSHCTCSICTNIYIGNPSAAASNSQGRPTTICTKYWRTVSSSWKAKCAADGTNTYANFETTTSEVLCTTFFLRTGSGSLELPNPNFNSSPKVYSKVLKGLGFNTESMCLSFVWPILETHDF